MIYTSVTDSSFLSHYLYIFGNKLSIPVVFLKWLTLFFKILRIIYFNLFVLYFDLAVLPIKIASISIKPVVGSVAACCVATLIN